MRFFLASKSGSLDCLNVYCRLKRHALLVEQDPQALMADVVDHPLSDAEVGQLGQAHVENGRS